MTFAQKLSMGAIALSVGVLTSAGNSQAFVSGAFEATDFAGVSTVATSAITVGLTAGLSVFVILVGFRLIKKIMGGLGVKK